MNRYTLWTLDPITGEMDRKIADDIEDFETAEQTAQVNANDRDRAILILDDWRDGDHVIVWPDWRQHD